MSEIELTETSKERLFEIITDKNLKIMELYQKINEKYDEIERLNNIIKEVREYINQLDKLEDKIDDYAISKYVRQELLEILDKGE